MSPSTTEFTDPPGVPLFEPARLIAQLGMPPDRARDVWCDTYLGRGFGPQWADWRIECFGLIVPWAGWTTGQAPPWPAVCRDGGRGTPVETGQVWLWRAWRIGSPLAAERRWHPVYGCRDMIVGGERPHGANDAEEARRGLTMIGLAEAGRGLPLGGADKGKYATRASYVEGIRELYRRADRSRWKFTEAPDSQLARWLEISERTLHARGREYGITTDDIRGRRA